MRPIRPVIATLTLFAAWSCADLATVPNPDDPWGLGSFSPSLAVVPTLPPVCGLPTTTRLIADENVPVGTVEITQGNGKLYVTYRTVEGWPIRKTALYVGGSLAGLPLAGGRNPQVGQFPYKGTHSGIFEVIWEVPLAGAWGPDLVVAAFAEVGSPAKAAWAEGALISTRGNWAMYATHSLSNCAVAPVGAAGGTVMTPDGAASLLIDPGALVGPVDITIEPATVEDLLEHIANGDAGSPGLLASSIQAVDLSPLSGVTPIPATIWRLTPKGLRFQKPVTIVLRYDEADIPPGVSEQQLSVFIINGVIPFLPAPSVVDAVNNTVTATIDYLSYAFVGYSAEQPEADLRVDRLVDSPDPVVAGGTVTYDVDVIAMGTSDAVEDAVLQLLFTTGDATFVSSEPDCTEIDSGVQCPLGTLVPEEVNTVQVVMTLPTAGQTLNVEARVIAPEGVTDPDLSNNSLFETTTVQAETPPDPAADLRVDRLVDSPDPVVAGGTVTYDVDVIATGTSDAVEDAVLQFLFTTGDVTFVSSDTDCTEIDSGVQCPLGTLVPEEVKTVQVVMTLPTAGQTVDVEARVIAPDGVTDPDLTNNSLFETTTVQAETPPDLRVDRLVDGPDPVLAGGNVTYDVDVSAIGAFHSVEGAVLQLLFTNGDATFVSSDAGCVEIDSGVECPLGTLLPEEGKTVQVVMTLPTAGQTVDVEARVIAPDGVTDPDLTNNSLFETTTAQAADMRITGAGGPPGPIALGLSASYRAEISNLGPEPAADVEVTYQLFGNVVAGTLSPGCTETDDPAFAGVEVRCDVGAVPVVMAGDRPIVVPPASFTPQETGEFTVRVHVSASTLDPVSDNNLFETTLTVTEPQADLRLELFASPVPIQEGSNKTYLVTVSAVGATQPPVTGALLQLLFTDGDADFVSSDAGCTDIEGVVTCPLGPLTTAATAVNVVMRHPTPGQVSVEARVSPPAGVTDPDASNNSAFRTTDVWAAPPVELQRGTVIEAVFPTAGDSATYVFDGVIGEIWRFEVTFLSGTGHLQLVIRDEGGTEWFPAGLNDGHASDGRSTNYAFEVQAESRYTVKIAPVAIGTYRLGVGAGFGRRDLPYGPDGFGVSTTPRRSDQDLLGMQLVGNDLVTIGWRALSRYDDDGALVTGFGVGGVVDLQAVLGASTLGHAMRVQPDGKIVVAARTTTAPFPWVVARFNANGTLDTGFGTGGIATIAMLGAGATPHGVRFQQNGAELDIIVAGYAGGTNQVGIVRLNPDGTLDTGFGTGGVVFENAGFGPGGMDIQSDGSILITGIAHMRRYTPTGARDLTFGADGLVTYGIPGQARGLLVLPDDGLLVLGEQIGDAFIRRLTANGALDGSFAGGGFALYNFGLPAFFQAATVDIDGSLIVVGHERTLPGGFEFLVTRMSANGVLDPAFGVVGYLTEARVDAARAVVIDSSGRILVGGHTPNPHADGIQLTRHLRE